MHGWVSPVRIPCHTIRETLLSATPVPCVINQGSTTAYENETDWRAAMTYNYAPIYRPWESFKSMENKSSLDAFIKELNLNWLPQSISFNTDMTQPLLRTATS